ncbi:MAG: FHA domain-containing protein [Nitrosomonas ureae]
MIQQQGHPARYETLNSLPVIIGRKSLANGVLIEHPSVSRQHARIEQRGMAYWLIDLGSTNGTLLNGKLLSTREECLLKDGDLFRIGDHQGNSVGITFRLGSNAVPLARTIYLDQSQLTQLARFTIGRDINNHLLLDHPSVSRIHAEVQKVPNGYLLNDRSSNGTFINGQRVTQYLLQASDQIQIGPFKIVYDKTGFSGATLSGNYRLDAIHLVREVYDKQHLCKRMPVKNTAKRILNDISISIYPKEFVALVGGSGTGKSTLMKALSGFTPAKSGNVLLNGEDLYSNFAAYRSALGYVPQDDIIHHQLTAQAALIYAAKLRLPDATALEIQNRVRDVLKQVEMEDHAHKAVHKLSGGQRKRVSIAVELLADPGLFFLDEPTSGLDPGLEKKMMHTLRKLADGGRTIVLVTHATANIDQCNHVAFMADGYLTYFGPPQSAPSFFETNDFADIYNKLSLPIHPILNPPPSNVVSSQRASIEPGQRSAPIWASYYQQSTQYDHYVKQRLGSHTPSNLVAPAINNSKQRVSAWQQFLVLAKRYFELIRRDATSLFVLLAVMPIIGMLLLVMANRHDLTGLSISAVKNQIQNELSEQRGDQDPAQEGEQFQGNYQIVGSAQKLLFMLALAANLLGIFAAAYEIVKEEAIYQRERMINLKIASYLMSKIAILGFFALVQCALLLMVVRFKVYYPNQGVFLPSIIEMYITLFLATVASISLGLLISSLIRNQSTIIYVILLVLFVQIIFAGAIFDLPKEAKPISYLTTTRWTLEALGSTVNMELLRSQGVTCLEPEDDTQRQLMGEFEAPCKSGQQKLTPSYNFNVTYRHEIIHLISRWLVLTVFAIIFIGLAALNQRRKDVI